MNTCHFSFNILKLSCLVHRHYGRKGKYKSCVVHCNFAKSLWAQNLHRLGFAGGSLLKKWYHHLIYWDFDGIGRNLIKSIFRESVVLALTLAVWKYRDAADLLEVGQNQLESTRNQPNKEGNSARTHKQPD